MFSTWNLTRISPTQNSIHATWVRATAKAQALQQGHMIWYDGRWPVGGNVSSLVSHRYVDCTSDYSVDIASRSCDAGLHIHAGFNIKQFYKNTAALLNKTIMSHKENATALKSNLRQLPQTTIHAADHHGARRCGGSASSVQLWAPCWPMCVWVTVAVNAVCGHKQCACEMCVPARYRTISGHRDIARSTNPWMISSLIV